MKKLLFLLTILFAALCLAGGSYVLYTGGKANPGYAVIPLLFSVICLSAYRERQK